MTHRLWITGPVLLAFLVGCGDDNPTGVSEVLTVELTVSPSHVHILQTEVTFTAVVRNSRDEPVTDFEALQVERRLAGSDTWRAVDLALSGTAYEGTYTFNSSGDYELRVAGQRPGDAEARVLYEVVDPLHVVPAHAEAGGYRVEFESFPGHIHEGETATLRFWVMEIERDASGDRPPITGLAPGIHCLEATGTAELHDALESAAGIYEFDHTFQAAGDSHIGLHFTGADGAPAEAAFEVHVVHAH